MLAVALLVGTLTAVPAAAEEPATLHRWVVNVMGTLSPELVRLEGAMADLKETAGRLVGSAGDRDSILALARDAERVARSADVLSRKADRIVELAEQLAGEAPGE